MQAFDLQTTEKVETTDGGASKDTVYKERVRSYHGCSAVAALVLGGGHYWAWLVRCPLRTRDSKPG